LAPCDATACPAGGPVGPRAAFAHRPAGDRRDNGPRVEAGPALGQRWGDGPAGAPVTALRGGPAVPHAVDRPARRAGLDRLVVGRPRIGKFFWLLRSWGAGRAGGQPVRRVRAAGHRGAVAAAGPDGVDEVGQPLAVARRPRRL